MASKHLHFAIIPDISGKITSWFKISAPPEWMKGALEEKAQETNTTNLHGEVFDFIQLD